MKSFIKFVFGLHRQIAHIKRFNTTPLTVKESVAEHSYFVAMYARLLSDYLEEKGYKIDKLKVVDSALVHDCEEPWSGDIVYMVRRENKEIAKAMDNISIKAIHKVLKPLKKSIREHWIEMWKLYQSGKSIEKQIVAVADIFSVLTYMNEQIRMGNQEGYKILNRIRRRLLRMIPKIEWLKELFDELDKGILQKSWNIKRKEIKEDEKLYKI